MQSTRVGKYEVWYENSDEFSELKREVWSHHSYYLDDLEEPVRVVDMGAHIGLSSLYFAQIYPKAEIIAYEPDKNSYLLLEKNIRENGLASRVSCLNLAVAPKTGIVRLQEPRFADEWRSGFGVIPGGWRGVLHSKEIEVMARGINEILELPTDLVKMDVEGMEYELIDNANWQNVSNLIVEVHPRVGKRRGAIDKKLRESGFRLQAREDESRYGKGLWTIVARKD